MSGPPPTICICPPYNGPGPQFFHEEAHETPYNPPQNPPPTQTAATATATATATGPSDIIVSIDEKEPECTVRNPEDFPMPDPNAPKPQPINGYPVPTQAQRDAPRPATFNDSMTKLLVMGFQKERAENALLAADSNLKRALDLLYNRS